METGKRRKKRRKDFFTAAIVILIITGMILLGGCEKKENIIYDAGSYGLSGLHLDGAELEIRSVYPSGAGLYLSNGGTALLILGEESCGAAWTNSNGVFTLSFGNLCGTGSFSEDKITVFFEEIGLEYEFSRGEKQPILSDQGIGSLEEQESRISGDWYGRMWFEAPEGEWADYEFRSMELSGSSIVQKEIDNTESGTLSLYNSFYSAENPVIKLSFEGENGEYHSVDGYVMSYPVHEFEIQMDLTEDTKANLRNTLIIEKPGDYGHVFTPEETSDASCENETIRVLRLSGTCRDSSGSFDYFIELLPLRAPSGVS